MSINRRLEKNDAGEHVDVDTGEVISPDESDHENESDTGWFKLFKDGIDPIAEVGNANIRLFFYVIKNMNEGNVLSRTQVQISKETSLSEKYISRKLNELQNQGLLVVGRNHYMVNPDVVFKGRPGKRRKAQYNYYERRRRKLYKTNK